MSRTFLGAVALLVSVSAVTGCSVFGGGEFQPISGLRIMTPSAPGGGWDITSKKMADVLQQEKLASGVSTYNVDGDGGIAGLNQLVNSADDATVMTTGQVMVGATVAAKSAKSLRDTTLIARTVAESEIFVVPADSKWLTLEQFLTDWAANPKGTPITGGSAGGDDQILAYQLADQIGIDPSLVRYVPNSGGGESVNKLLSGEAKAGISGVATYAAQVKSNKLRALGVSADRRSTVLPDVKTLREQGLGVTLTKWRALVARPGLSSSAKQRLVDMVTRLHESAAWQRVVSANDWLDQFLTGPDLDRFVDQETSKVSGLLAQVGLRGGA
ncbi:tripartite tricarboxylate transporter substrate-binding protein [Kutzneria viridogrisea]|uniref:Tricarboxylic transport membrane protein n=1 Tax=Kutzneria viridogrisea TaxID=47990 RepID=A0ABR6BVZ2_9PSEU|nr:putative tricarboxylic transport membrane protein [Kutzneria viridogrisea]